MTSDGRGRVELTFWRAFAIGEMLAFGAVGKLFIMRDGELRVWLDALAFLLLSAVALAVAAVIAGVCAYRTWRGRARAASSPSKGSPSWLAPPRQTFGGWVATTPRSNGSTAQ